MESNSINGVVALIIFIITITILRCVIATLAYLLYYHFDWVTLGLNVPQLSDFRDELIVKNTLINTPLSEQFQLYTRLPVEPRQLEEAIKADPYLTEEKNRFLRFHYGSPPPEKAPSATYSITHYRGSFPNRADRDSYAKYGNVCLAASEYDVDRAYNRAVDAHIRKATVTTWHRNPAYDNYLAHKERYEKETKGLYRKPLFIQYIHIAYRYKKLRERATDTRLKLWPLVKYCFSHF